MDDPRLLSSLAWLVSVVRVARSKGSTVCAGCGWSRAATNVPRVAVPCVLSLATYLETAANGFVPRLHEVVESSLEVLAPKTSYHLWLLSCI